MKLPFYLLTTALAFSTVLAADLSALPEPLRKVLENYLMIQEKLAGDQFTGVTAAAKAIQALEPTLPPSTFPAGWTLSVDAMVKAPNLHEARVADQRLSANIIAALALAKAKTGVLHVAHCPMVKADWVQADGTAIRNPYFGSAMLDCGSFTTVY